LNYKSFCSILTFVLLAAVVALFGSYGVASAGSKSYPVKGLSLEFSAGYRIDQLNWNKAGIPDSPPGLGVPVNVLSELTWTDLEISELSLIGRKTAGNVYIRGSFDIGFIYSGANRDSDYARDNRVMEYSQSENNGGDGTVWDVSVGGGYKKWLLTSAEGAFTFRPLIGVSVHKQNLTVTDGYQTIDLIGGRTGVIPGLDSTYKAIWFGPWAGFETGYAAGRLNLYATAEAHGAAYRGEANWNKRNTWQHPVSFEHFANAYGVIFSIGADYAITEGLILAAAFKRQDWHTFRGTDRIYHASGAVTDNPLNEVNWISNSVTLALELTY